MIRPWEIDDFNGKMLHKNEWKNHQTPRLFTVYIQCLT